MVRAESCVICGRPLPPPRGWWGRLNDWFLPPPPLCRPLCFVNEETWISEDPS